ncbi:MAG: SCO family protein [Planctomycetota bacterium]|nr:SCO family protein [Planctomycetota bacterium]
MTRSYLLLGLIALLLGTAYAVVLWRMQPRASDDGVLAAAPESTDRFAKIQPFELVDSRGKAVTHETWLGRPSIVAFVFTRCTGPCPRVTSSMKKLYEATPGDAVRLVTISVDPEYDTPEVLAQYAKSLDVDVDRWMFLTGSLAAVHAVSEKSFLLPMQRDATLPVGESITHRTYLTIVDKHGEVRGYYDGESDAGIEAALARARFLARSP